MTCIKRMLTTAAAVLALTAAAQADTTIELWSFLERGPANARTQSIDKILTGFEKANPGVRVNVVVIDWQEISPMLLRGARSGQVPDVAMIFSAVLPIPVAAGAVMPLEDRIGEWSAERKEDTVIFPQAQSDEHIYALPYEMRVTGIMYRKDLLEKAGIEPPKTLEELAAVAKQLKPEGGVGVGLGFSPAKPDAGMDWFVPTLVGMGGAPLTEDGKANFDTPEMRKLVGWVKDLVDSGVLPLDVALLGDNDVQTFAEAGKTVFLPKMTHRLGTIRTNSGLGEAYQMMDAPTFDPAKPAPAYVQGWNLVIPKGAKHPDEAWKLIDYWTSAEVQLEQSKDAGYLPVLRSVAGDEAFKDAGYMQWALEYAAREPLQFDWPDNYFTLYSTLATMVSDVISGRMDFDAAAAKAETAYNEAIK